MPTKASRIEAALMSDPVEKVGVPNEVADGSDRRNFKTREEYHETR
jgi:hypothetical protein